MKRRCSAARPFATAGLYFAAFALALSPSVALSQRQEGAAAATISNVLPDARPLIVAIRSYQPGRSLPQIGSGVVIGIDDARVYVATALHVVDGADRIWVTVESARSDSARAEVAARPEGGGLDLAVIVLLRSELPADFDPSMNRLGDPGRLNSGDPVSPVGCPDEVCWSAPASPDRVLASTPLEVLFQSDFVKRGSSGGALFDRWWELVGVVTTSDPPRASAIPIDYVIEQAETWGIPVSIHRPGIPRAGYRTTIGAAILSPTASLSDRFPSSRFDITYMLKYPVSVHAGYLRLAPGELDGCPESNDPNLDTLLAVRAPCEMVMNSVVAGVGANLVWRRLTLRVFGEGGLGLVQGRFDQGGIFVQDPQLTYVPNPKSTDETTTFIGGVGVIAEYTIFPRAILQALGGYWAYNGDPFVNEPLFPDEFRSFAIPHLFFGVGLKLGL